MTTATATATGLRWNRVLDGEWIKMRATRSTWWTLGVGLVGLIASGIFTSVGVAAGAVPATPADVGPLGGALTGLGFAEIVIAVLGVLVVTGDYASGAVRTTLIAVPGRIPVLTAKPAAVAALVVVTASAAVGASFIVARILIARAGLNLPIDGAVTRSLLGAGLYLSIVAVIGSGLGWLLRSTAGALGAMFGLFYAPQLIALVLPTAVATVIVPYLPATAGTAITQPVTTPGSLSPGAGLAVFAGYALIVLAAAAVALRRRDA